MKFLACRTSWGIEDGLWVPAGDEVFVNCADIAALRREYAGVVAVVMKSSQPYNYASTLYVCGDMRSVALSIGTLAGDTQ